ncbi:MAG: sodium:solute symporter [Oscillospiraceae bacterium]|nr:sodium:solute symporter [Oscillospiraceae bacterium]
MTTKLILVLYILMMTGIGLLTRKNSSSVDGFVLGGRNAGSWLTAFAFSTSYFSAVAFVGYAGQFGWHYGASAGLIGVGNALIGSMLAWMVLGRRTRCMTKYLDASTMPEFFEKRYKSEKIKTASAVIIFIFLIPYTASVYNGLSRLFSMAFHIDYSVCIIAMAVLTAVYVILGGYTATAINDFVQGIIILGGIVAVVMYALSYKGGLFSALEQLGQISTPEIRAGSLKSFFGPAPLDMLGVTVLTSLGTWGLPQMVHKFYAIKNEDAISKGTVISTIFTLIVAGGSFFLGGFGRLYCTADPADTSGKILVFSEETGKIDFDAIIPALLQTCLPEILVGLVVVLVLSASMSTLSSLVLTSASTVTIDIVRPVFKGKFNEKREVLIMRGFILFFLALSVIIALNKNAYISTLMSVSWGAIAGSFIGPFLYGLFGRKTTRTAVGVSFVCGVGLTLAHMTVFSLGFFPELTAKAASFPLNLASPVNASSVIMILSLITVPCVSAVTRNKDQKALDKIFECYGVKGGRISKGISEGSESV